MSRFLAPIHKWLFNKIKLHEELEKEIVEGFRSQYGNEIDSIERDNIKKYGDRLPDSPLEEIIDTDNIHGWLQDKISIAETRQASILAYLFKQYKDNGILLAKSIYENNAIKHGKLAREGLGDTSAEDIYKIINNYVLDGMPCDNANSITKAEGDLLEYKQDHCLHIKYWNESKVDPKLMYDLRSTWIGTFVNTLNPDFKYQVSVEKIDGDREGFLHRIYKK
ncbi:hypothetical protein CLPU_2c02530 [Gottschalkia purinilytica]|uniref:Uncharacterized protein n=1 Tax=Gottschalkia purinilytica TaxID=1503 RepID=A0A0L0WED7_GOTPU|nr:hypothetical protein [Gottschalkia purinilytica]KNF09801.1 hypothetical protein CLPU_2c02530 [Gottschalkia purinilytica]